jgi:hypothetical protein
VQVEEDDDVVIVEDGEEEEKEEEDDGPVCPPSARSTPRNPTSPASPLSSLSSATSASGFHYSSCSEGDDSEGGEDRGRVRRRGPVRRVVDDASSDSSSDRERSAPAIRVKGPKQVRYITMECLQWLLRAWREGRCSSWGQGWAIGKRQGRAGGG